MKRLVLASLFLSSVAFAQSKPPAKATPKAKAGPAVGGVKGVIIYEGSEDPERKQLVRDSDPYCEKVKKQSEDLIVTKGKLKDVLVRVQNGTMGKHAVPAQPVLFDQRECMYTPRVVGVIAGQKLAARNSDGTFHNVHGTINGKLLWNKPQPAKAPDLSLESVAQPGDVIEVVCDVHPWMKAFAVVQDHPFFAVTGDDGAFEIKGLAPGKYTLEAWHPKLGVKTMKIQIGKGAKAVVPVRLSYKPY